ncbi:plasmid mobilization protein [Duganella hordei]|uniref:plasmid mobilization protein n=1 Tax=Duganella hordei TaxID=2865934 RepID=UPI0030E95356
MSSKPRPSRINIELGPLKARWLSYCHANGVTPSEAFRQVVEKLTADDTRIAPAYALTEKERCKIRRVIRLTPDEAQKIRICADQEGYSVSRWLIALIRVRIYAAPQFGQFELATLVKSNLLLLAAGRNLNQIARAINVAGAANRRVPEAALTELRALITEHIDMVSEVIARNVERWRAS